MSTIRVLASVGVLATIAAPALADYQTCMTHCMTQHDFDHCHPICTDYSDRTDDGPHAVAKPVETCLLTDAEQYRLIDNFFYDNYEVYGTINPSDDDRTVFEVEFQPPDEECRGVVRLTSDCEVVRYEKFHCEWTGWAQEAAREREREAREEARERERKENIYSDIDTAIRTHFRADGDSFYTMFAPSEVVNIEPNRILDIKPKYFDYTFKVTVINHGVDIVESGFAMFCTIDVNVTSTDHGYRVKELLATSECRYGRTE